MEQEEKPKRLYRGIVLTDTQVRDFIFEGIDMVPPNPPKIDEQGRKTVGDGNEYGIYMTDNHSMVDTAYGNPGDRGGRALDRSIRIAQGRFIELPLVGIEFEIDTTDLDIRKPWISSALQGHYNNGFEGDEWIADSIPSKNYRVTRIRIGRDLLHAEEDIPVANIANVRELILSKFENREEGLQLFLAQVGKMSLGARNSLDFYSSRMKLFRELYGDDGIYKLEPESIDASSADGMLQYLLAKVYSKSPEEPDYKTLEYINGIKDKFKPKTVEEIEDIILADIEKNSVTRRDALDRAQREGREQGTLVFDAKQERFESVLELLRTRRERDLGTDVMLEGFLDYTEQVVGLSEIGKEEHDILVAFNWTQEHDDNPQKENDSFGEM